MLRRQRRLITAVIAAGLFVASCSSAEAGAEANEIETLFLPELNEQYAPRDIKLRLQIERSYLESGPWDWPPEEALPGVSFNMDWQSLEASKLGPWDQSSVATISLSIVPTDGISRAIDASRPDYSPLKGFADSPIVGTLNGLSVRTNNRQSRAGGPIDEILTQEGNNNFVIDCYDPGNEQRRTCSMRYILGVPRSGFDESRFGLGVAIVFHRSLLPRWQAIKAKVDGFVMARARLVAWRDAPEPPRR